MVKLPDTHFHQLAMVVVLVNAFVANLTVLHSQDLKVVAYRASPIVAVIYGQVGIGADGTVVHGEEVEEEREQERWPEGQVQEGKVDEGFDEKADIEYHYKDFEWTSCNCYVTLPASNSDKIMIWSQSMLLNCKRGKYMR